MSATPSSESAPRWHPGARVRVRGRRWRVEAVTDGSDCAALRLRELGRDAGFAPSLTILTPFDRPVPLEPSRQPAVVRPRRWFHELDRSLLDVRPFGALAATARTPIRLMPHQLEPALALLRHGATRLLVADGVGLGKTIQAGVILLELAERGPELRAIVMVPAGLRDQWSSELRVHFRLAGILADSAWLKRAAAERPPGVSPWSLPGIYIASHDFVKRPEVLRPLEDVVWDVAVVDEAHAATKGTDRRAAIDAIACRARRVILLTATPHADDPAEFSALCQIGRLGDREPVHLFARSREDVATGEPRKSIVLAVSPSDAERRMHVLLQRYSAHVWKDAGRRNDDRARLASIVLRKRALSSAASLAASIERRVLLLAAPEEPQPEQLSLGFADEDPLEDEVPDTTLAAPGLADQRRERRWLAAIGEAARLAARAETKSRRLIRLLDRLREPAIVFTEYRDTLVRLERRIRASGRSTVSLHGGMSLSERAQAIRAFTQGGRTLLATDAAAEGLNLHHRCRIVVHYELPWNPARLEQRAGRVDRLGQGRRVHEIALVAADTAERLVIAPLLARCRKPGPAEGPGRGARTSHLLNALTESRVADAVMSGRVLVPDQTASELRPSDDFVRTDLKSEAAEEARRLDEERTRITRSWSGSAERGSRRPWVSTFILSPSTTTDVPDGLVLVYAAALETDEGRWVHADAVAVRVGASADPNCLVTPSQIRQLVAPFADPDCVLGAWLERTIASRLHEASVQHRRLHDVLKFREDAMRQRRASTARQLVQPGLFDRRSIRERARATTTVTEPAAPAEAPRTRTTIALLAAILVSARSRRG